MLGEIMKKIPLLVLLLLTNSSYNQQQKIFPDPQPDVGFIQVTENPKNQLFYWHFQAQNNPNEAPLVIYIEGGPGCSSAFGIFTLMGPYEIHKYSSDYKKAELRTTSWTTNANMLFVDQPLGVGFSTSESDKFVKNYEDIQDHFYEFFLKFLDKYPEYKKKINFSRGIIRWAFCSLYSC